LQFEVGDIVHQTIVEVRDYNSKIKQAAILAFEGVLNDIPGQPRGVMVTRTGFQPGAETYAKKRGIKLYRLQHWQHRTVISDVSYATFALDQHLVMHITAYREEVHLKFHVAPPSKKKMKKYQKITHAVFRRCVCLTAMESLSGLSPTSSAVS
jgi:hypothetical protein